MRLSSTEDLLSALGRAAGCKVVQSVDYCFLVPFCGSSLHVHASGLFWFSSTLTPKWISASLVAFSTALSFEPQLTTYLSHLLLLMPPSNLNLTRPSQAPNALNARFTPSCNHFLLRKLFRPGDSGAIINWSLSLSPISQLPSDPDSYPSRGQNYPLLFTALRLLTLKPK